MARGNTCGGAETHALFFIQNQRMLNGRLAHIIVWKALQIEVK